MRSFAFDLNLPLSFEVEIEAGDLLEKAIDILISKAGTSPILTRFLVEFIQNRAEDEKNWDIGRELATVAKLLLHEDSQEHLRKLEKLSLDEYTHITKKLIAFNQKFENELQGLGHNAIEIIDSKGIPVNAFYYSSKGIYGFFKYLDNRIFNKTEPNSYVQKTISDNKWVSAKATQSDEADIEDIKQDLLDIFYKVQALADEGMEKYTLYSEVVKNIYPMAILSQINNVMNEYKSENNIVLISEFNQRIADVVLHEPIPFIYERVGEKFRHFLIDEFQDTSIMQWHNMLPLIDNSLAEGNSNLIVGDGKQAIYRWRGGEVEQFSSLPEIYNKEDSEQNFHIENALKENYQENALNSNFRSRPEIVKFNNDFFLYLIKYLPEGLSGIYSDVEQIAANQEQGGFVHLEFFDEENSEGNFEEFNCLRILETIKETEPLGYALNDIAILCRSNKSAAIIARYLLDNSIPVISSESLLISASPQVRLVIALLNLLYNPDNKVVAIESAKLLMELKKIQGEFHEEFLRFINCNEQQNTLFGYSSVFELFISYGYELDPGRLQTLQLYDLCEELLRTFNLFLEPDPYVQFFLDNVLKKSLEVDMGVFDFLDWWENKKDKLSIVVPEGVNAVSIMTIHKAKGLEFPVVIYPFANERFKKTIDKLWLSMTDETVPELKTVLVNSTKSLEKTRYKKVVRSEDDKSLLDMLNLLYVVLTRPTDHLYIYTANPPSSKSNAISVPAFFKNFLLDYSLWKDDQNIYLFGEETISKKKIEPVANQYIPDSMVSTNWYNRMFLSLQAPDHWDMDAPFSKQEWGNLIHLILSKINDATELQDVLDHYHVQGIIDEKLKEQLFIKVKEFIEAPEIQGFFRKGIKVKSEADIILPDGQTFRPDRIIFENDRTYIIDFKTGLPSPKHNTQLQGYVDLARQMNLPEPKGVLLYLDNHQPVFVN